MGQTPDRSGAPVRPRKPEWVWPEGPYRPMRFPQRPLQIRGLDPIRRRDPETGGTGVIRSTTFTPPASMLGFTPQEPTVANSGDIFFCTGNLFAGVSSDGGRNWSVVNPGTIFGTNAAGPVCCDQIVRYLPDHDRFVWIIQYQTNAGSEENAYRIAYASPRDVVAGNWAWVDYTSAGLGQGGRFLDFPDLAFGNAYAYFSFNVFPNDDGSFSVGSAIARIPLSGFSSGDFSGSRVYSDPSGFTLRIAQNTGSDAHFFSTVSTSTVRIYNWPEFSDGVSQRDVGVASFRNSGYSSQTPADGSGNQYNWLGGANQRGLGCARAGGRIWMAWNAAKDTANGRPNSYVRLTVVNESDWSVAFERDYFSENYATAYPALAVNSLQDVAISYAFGGGRACRVTSWALPPEPITPLLSLKGRTDRRERAGETTTRSPRTTPMVGCSSRPATPTREAPLPQAALPGSSFSVGSPSPTSILQTGENRSLPKRRFRSAGVCPQVPPRCRWTFPETAASVGSEL